MSRGSPAAGGVAGRFGGAVGEGAFGSVVTFLPSGFGFGAGFVVGVGFGVGFGAGFVVGVGLGFGFGFGFGAGFGFVAVVGFVAGFVVAVVFGFGFGFVAVVGFVAGVVVARSISGTEDRATVVVLFEVALGDPVPQAARSVADATMRSEPTKAAGWRLVVNGPIDPGARLDATFASMRGGARDDSPGGNVVDPSTRAPSLAGPLVRELDRRVAEEQATSRLPSLVVGLVRDGEVVWWGSAGSTGAPGDVPADAWTQYRIGSISKTLAAVLVMRLRDEGALALTDPIGSHLPELRELPVTIAHLLSHTSGLRAETPAPWWERVGGGSFEELCAASLRPADLLWRPGRRFHYSNVGYAVLGELVSRLRGAPYLRVVADELLSPLSMDRTTPRPVAPFAEGLAVHPHAPLVLDEPEHDAGAMTPAGQFWSTVTDLARWSDVLLGARPEVLGSESAEEMAEPIGFEDVPGQPWSSSYGLGLQLRNEGGRRLVGHGGAMPGHCAMLLADASSRDVVIGFTNSTYKAARPAFYDELLTTLASGSPRPTPGFETLEVPEALSALLGTWYWGPVEYRISVADPGRLQLRAVAGGRSCDFVSLGDGGDRYVGEWGYFRGETLCVCRRVDGSISHLDVASFVLARAPYEPAATVPGGVEASGWHAHPA